MLHLSPALVLVAAPAVLLADPPVRSDHAERMRAGTALFERSVGPALAAHCLECHGGEKVRGGLDLATRERLLEGGDSGVVVDLAQSGASRLLALVRHEDEPAMPPKKPMLPEALLGDLARWIELGAPYARPLVEGAEGAGGSRELTVTDSDREFWAFRRLVPAEPPAVGEGWARNEIDRFLFARLEAEGLRPNPEAELSVLSRRASLDLLGLPPEAEDEVAAGGDYEAYVGRLLDSPHYGERLARHWMDVARFAESEGFEHDYDRKNAYHYRDFLVEAFNRDLPWDTFAAWQIAGDELAPEEPLAWKATGFLAAGAFPTQLTEAEFERARYDELDDMVGTAGAAFLGLSVSCARCHDHKYDPVPASDYYRLAANFATAIRSEKELEFQPETYASRLAAWEEQLGPLESALAGYEAEALEPAFAAWLKAPTGLEAIGDGAWRVLEPDVVESREGADFRRLPDGSWLAEGAAAANDEYLVEAEVGGGAAALRLEALAHESLPRKGPGRASNGNFALGDLFVEEVEGELRRPLKLVAVRATHEQNGGGLSVAASIDGDPDKTGWAVDGGGIGSDQAAVFVFDKPLAKDALLSLRLRFHLNGQHSIGRLRLSVADAAEADFETGRGAPRTLVEGAAALGVGAEALTEAQREALREWFAGRDADWRRLREARDAQLARRPGRDLRPVLVCAEGLPLPSHHANGRGYPHFYPEVHELERGDPKQRRGVAEAGYLEVLMPAGADGSKWRREPPAGAATSYRRASLAAWLIDVEEGAGHLLARVAVNRVWQQHFGRGLVATPNDFGLQGEPPSHPELLDWLAADFIRNGWSLKRLHRQIVTSAAYRQSAASFAEGAGHEGRGEVPAGMPALPGGAARDPENVLLWRFPSRRLEGEAIRDSMLAVSGLLDPTPFGPGSLDEGMRRRSVYFTVKRSRPVVSMLVFDWPEHLVSIGARPVTTVAPQSLYLMNSPQVRQCAEGLARRGAGKLEAVYRLALNRSATDGELAAAAEFLGVQAGRYGGGAEGEARAFVDFCHALLGSNEFLLLP
jgi:mono/diheme cytochrome c family protein